MISGQRVISAAAIAAAYTTMMSPDKPTLEEMLCPGDVAGEAELNHSLLGLQLPDNVSIITQLHSSSCLQNKMQCSATHIFTNIATCVSVVSGPEHPHCVLFLLKIFIHGRSMPLSLSKPLVSPFQTAQVLLKLANNDHLVAAGLAHQLAALHSLLPSSGQVFNCSAWS